MGSSSVAEYLLVNQGYSTVKTNLYTVAPNVAGTAVLIILTQSSDCRFVRLDADTVLGSNFSMLTFPDFRERSIHICVALALTFTGFVVLGTIDVLANEQVAYFACFLIAMGASAPSVLTSTWYSNNTTSESRRIVL